MGPAEIAHRLHEQWVVGLLRIGQAVAPHRRASLRSAEQFGFCAATAPQLPSLPWAFNPDEREIERGLGGHASALGVPWVWRDDPLVWHEAPDTGKVWPRGFFSTIPYRAGNSYGDARIVWEPSRLQHLIPLGLLAARGQDDTGRRAADLLARQLGSWVDANPPYAGVHYVSTMECGLRVMAACHAVDLARAWFDHGARVWTALATLVDSHARLIERRLSRYSSAGNHTLAECAGLIYAGVLFPEFPEASNWLATGSAVFEQEARRQILPDGGGLEQAWHYLAFDVDLCGLVAALLRHHGRWASSIIRYAHTLGRDFLRAFADTPASLPAIGDADGGFALSPMLCLSWQGRPPSQPDWATFADTGCSIIRHDEGVLVFDHGPLGMAPSYGHGHADALSVVLQREGRDVLIDPGTYTYTGEPIWRTYFRSTAAHNTVTVDAEDQARQETAFQWSHPYSAHLVRSEKHSTRGTLLLARHDGYSRLGVEHWRGVAHLPRAGWLVWDYLSGRGRHGLDLYWHLGAEPTERPDGVVFSGFASPLCLTVSGGDTVIRRGGLEPISGWRSRRYGLKEPITTLRVRFEGPLPHEFVTRVTHDRPAAAPAECQDAISGFREWVAQALRRLGVGME